VCGEQIADSGAWLKQGDDHGGLHAIVSIQSYVVADMAT